MHMRRFDKQFDPEIETRFTATTPGKCETCDKHVRVLYRLTSTGKTYCGMHIDAAAEKSA